MPILIVDDDPAIRELVREILEMEGYRVRVARDGREALALVEQERPSLIILDMRMPELDGWAVAQELNRRGNRPPLLVTTAARDAADSARDVGADGYLAKPFSLDELLAAVARLRVPRD